MFLYRYTCNNTSINIKSDKVTIRIVDIVNLFFLTETVLLGFPVELYLYFPYFCTQSHFFKNMSACMYATILCILILCMLANALIAPEIFTKQLLYERSLASSGNIEFSSTIAPGIV